MMQSDIQQTILNGEYSLGLLSNNNLTIVNSGGLPIRQNFIQWFRLNLQALQDLFNIGDFTSSTATTLFDRINTFVGIPYGAVLDPNYQYPGVVILINSIKISKTQANLIDAGGGNWYLPYLDDSNQAIPSAYVPEYISINGVTLNGWTLDDSTVPPRVYSFANNDAPQDIELTLI